MKNLVELGDWRARPVPGDDRERVERLRARSVDGDGGEA